MNKLWNKVKIWGVFFNLNTLEEFIEIIHEHLNKNTGSPLHITGINPETMAQAQDDIQLLSAINDSDLVNIDNTLVLLMLRLSGVKAPERVATPDLFDSMLCLAEKHAYPVYLLGAKEEVLQRAILNIRNEYPGLIISGYRNGYFKNEKIEKVCEEITSAKPKMLFLALPTPDKELFIYRYKHKLMVPVMLGIGGAIDVKSGLIRRAPLFLRKIGLEGLHRVMQNPINYGKRYLTMYPVFIKIVIKNIFRKKVKNNSDI